MRVVVADNDEDFLELLTLELTLEGHDVLAAVRDGLSAVRACAEHHPQALVVDFRMPPGLDGIETIRAVKGVAPGTACILHSNYRSTAMQQQARRLGAQFVPKSTLAALREALKGIASAG